MDHSLYMAAYRLELLPLGNLLGMVFHEVAGRRGRKGNCK